MSGETPQVTPDEFFRTDIRVGRILRAEEFPQARKPAYKLVIDFGELRGAARHQGLLIPTLQAL